MSVSVNVHGDFPLVLTHNRDEFFSRETSLLEQRGDVLCAIDSFGGGTWMGLNCKTGRIASLTNVRCLTQPGCRSRGELVSRVLRGDDDATASTAYQGYNLLHGNLSAGDAPTDLRFTYSTPPEWRPHTQALPVGRDGQLVATKSNDHGGGVTVDEALDGSPTSNTWPKAAWLRSEVAATLGRSAHLTGEVGARALLQALEPVLGTSEMPSPFADAACQWLPSDVADIGVDKERALQRAPFLAAFDLPGPYAPSTGETMYGTVSQTVIIQSRSAGCVFYAYRAVPEPRQATARLRSASKPALPPWTWKRVPLLEHAPRVAVGSKRVTVGAGDNPAKRSRASAGPR